MSDDDQTMTLDQFLRFLMRFVYAGVAIVGVYAASEFLSAESAPQQAAAGAGAVIAYVLARAFEKIAKG